MLKKFAIVALAATFLSACTTTDPYTGEQKVSNTAGGAAIGAGIGGLPGIEHESVNLHERGPGRVSPHFVHGRIINLISGQVSPTLGRAPSRGHRRY